MELIGKGSSLSQALRETEAKLEESVSLAKDMESKVHMYNYMYNDDNLVFDMSHYNSL